MTKSNYNREIEQKELEEQNNLREELRQNFDYYFTNHLIANDKQIEDLKAESNLFLDGFCVLDSTCEAIMKVLNERLKEPNSIAILTNRSGKGSGGDATQWYKKDEEGSFSVINLYREGQSNAKGQLIILAHEILHGVGKNQGRVSEELYKEMKEDLKGSDFVETIERHYESGPHSPPEGGRSEMLTLMTNYFFDNSYNRENLHFTKPGASITDPDNKIKIIEKNYINRMIKEFGPNRPPIFKSKKEIELLKEIIVKMENGNFTSDDIRGEKYPDEIVGFAFNYGVVNKLIDEQRPLAADSFDNKLESELDRKSNREYWKVLSAISSNNDKDLELCKDLFPKFVSVVGPQGNTLLHYAVKNRNLRAVELSLEVGGSPFIKNNLGQTALDLCENFRKISKGKASEKINQMEELFLQHLAAVNQIEDQPECFFDNQFLSDKNEENEKIYYNIQEERKNLASGFPSPQPTQSPLAVHSIDWGETNIAQNQLPQSQGNNYPSNVGAAALGVVGGGVALTYLAGKIFGKSNVKKQLDGEGIENSKKEQAKIEFQQKEEEHYSDVEEGIEGELKEEFFDCIEEQEPSPIEKELSSTTCPKAIERLVNNKSNQRE